MDSDVDTIYGAEMYDGLERPSLPPRTVNASVDTLHGADGTEFREIGTSPVAYDRNWLVS